ncbi:hypothetical protein Hanom_Chr02g00118251 [Helianthus anomalus]
MIESKIPKVGEKKALRLKMKREKMMVQNSEAKEWSQSTNEASCFEPVCRKCDKSRYDDVKLLKDAETLTLENKNLKQNEKDLKNQIKSLENENLVLDNNKIDDLKN